LLEAPSAHQIINALGILSHHTNSYKFKEATSGFIPCLTTAIGTLPTITWLDDCGRSAVARIFPQVDRQVVPIAPCKPGF
jgi:hypothetical protein